MSEGAAVAPNAALLTPAGRGAVATIRVQGAQALEAALKNLFTAINQKTLHEQDFGQVVFGRWGQAPATEDVVVCRRSPDVLEIHCHGGDAASARILSDLQRFGCVTVAWTSQCRDRLDADCAVALSQASTVRTALLLQEQANGQLRAAYQSLLAELQGTNPGSARALLESLRDWSTFGRHLSVPWNVVLTGRPNVGKSSLINALLGYERAIVWDQPGTTRDVVTALTAFDGWPVLLADTAGQRAAEDPLEAAGIARATHHLQTADLRLVLVDVSQSPTASDRLLLQQWPEALVVAHKSDLPDQWQGQIPAEAIRVSSRTGQGLDQLQAALVQRLVPHPPTAGTPIPVGDHGQRIQKALEALQADDVPAAIRALEGLFTRPEAVFESRVMA